MTAQAFSPVRLERFRDVQELVHDAADVLGALKTSELTLGQKLQLSAVLDKIDKVEVLLEEALEMGT